MMRAIDCLFFAAAAFGVACADSRAMNDAGPRDAGVSDAGATDAGATDAGYSALFADVQWAVRCEATGDCAGAQDVDVCGFDDAQPCVEGSESVDMSCLVTEVGSTRTLTFQVRQGGPSLAIEGAEVSLSGGGVTGDCVVTVTDSEGTYRGACGSAAPSAAQPCQVTDVAFSDDFGNPTFDGRLFCQGLNAEAGTSGEREITSPGAGPGPASAPGRFRIANCPGLDL